MRRFTENLVVTPLPDGHTWIVLSDFGYEVGEEGSGDEINVETGFHTDFASIPRPLWAFLPRWGKYGNKDGSIRYRASEHDCAACPLKQQCCPNMSFRKVVRSVHESARDVARAVRKTPAYRRTRRQRKQVEMLFAHMKRILKMDRLRLRGLTGARDEFLLTATAQNLRRMTKYLGTDPPGIREMALT